ncbi:LPS-assembly protein LptD [Gilvimarinus algae]|uniref:LPS-assembly protein LptD n=1 Tax=Gilvimarinus algae TaxID=3058037 RepID=A0ABT8TME8_9GAMM|nr:LPS-assembly protein LptD [Gilvimarinus sp. SDUM040014]MDO3383562.1 LPS-assembly protein LptD [Gilvimarinus sp. SDUM040014]
MTISTALLVLAAVCARAEQTDRTAHPMDWVPARELPAEALERLPAGCCGAYISPYTPPEDAAPLDQTPINVRANRSSASGGREITLEGDVELRQGPRLLQTQKAQLNQQTRELLLEEDITLREEGLLIRADRARLVTHSEDATLDNARFVLHESRIHGEASRLEKFGERLLKLSDGSLSTCEPDSEFWRLRAAELALHPEQNYGTAKHARLEIKNVPVLYIPYMIFPVGDERQSGLLFPSFSTSTSNGVEYAQPIYWNIAPQMDATFTPRYLEKRGTLLDAEFRHLSSYFATDVSGAFLADDKGGYDRQAENDIASGELTEEEAYPYKGEDRWLVQLEQTGGRKSRLKTRIDYTDVSDVDYLRDITSSDVDVEYQSSLQKFGAVSYASDHWDLGASARETRYLNEASQRPYKELPHLYARGRYAQGDWLLKLDNDYTRFDLVNHYQRPTDSLVVGERLNTDYRLAWDKRWQWGFVTPEVGVKTLSYQLQQADFDTSGAMPAAAVHSDSPSLVVPQASLDAGLFFERFGELGGSSFIQTLEPRLFYFYSDYEDHSSIYQPLNDTNAPIAFDTRYITFDYNQLFRTTRFTGGDRIDDANQLSAGITTRFISARTGQERLALSLGQIYRFDPPRVALDPENQPESERYRQSEYAGRISARISDRFRLSGDALYDQHDHQLTSASASVQYADDADRLLSLTYRFQRRVSGNDLNPSPADDRSLDQLDVGAFVPVTDSWSLFARANYDFTFDLELDTYAGLEYNDCCYRVRLMWREWLNFDYNSGNQLETVTNNDYDRGYFIDLQLKGLASISDRVGSLLSKTLLGYAEREDNFQ